MYWYTWLSTEGITASAFDYSGLRRLRAGAAASTRPALTTFHAPGAAAAGLREAVGRRAPLPLTSPYACGGVRDATGATALS